MLPWVLLFGGLRGTQLAIYLLKLAAGLAMYAGFARYLAAPGAGLVCGYAYAFSTFASYSTQSVDVMFSALLFPLIFAAALEMFRRGSERFALALGVLVACAFSVNMVHALIAPVAVLLPCISPLTPLPPVPAPAHWPRARAPRRWQRLCLAMRR